MKYGTAAAFRTALEARLKAEEHDGVGISRLRKRVVFERLLAWLQRVAPDAWLLKGGFALQLRLGWIGPDHEGHRHRLERRPAGGSLNCS